MVAVTVVVPARPSVNVALTGSMEGAKQSRLLPCPTEIPYAWPFVGEREKTRIFPGTSFGPETYLAQTMELVVVEALMAATMLSAVCSMLYAVVPEVSRLYSFAPAPAAFAVS